MFGKFVKRGGIIVSLGGTCKIIQWTVNDEWDNVIYRTRKSIIKSFNLLSGKADIVKSTTAPRVVVVGTGWGALSFIQYLDEDDVNLTIVSPR